MHRALLSMWPYLLRTPFKTDAIRFLGRRPTRGTGPALKAHIGYGVPQEFWLWRFCGHVRRFATIQKGRVRLHYTPELVDEHHPADLLHGCHSQLEYLEDRLATRLPKNIVVYLFARQEEIQRIFGPEYGGTALALSNAVVVAHHEHVRESLRHELAHLHAQRWNPYAPPILCEGLAVWLQETKSGLPIDTLARRYFEWSDPVLPALLRRDVFFSRCYGTACYALAGSFTGHLIRRYGWRSYRSLYRRCNGTNFGAQFERCLGVSLKHAEWQWRNYVYLMEHFNRRLGRSGCPEQCG